MYNLSAQIIQGMDMSTLLILISSNVYKINEQTFLKHLQMNIPKTLIAIACSRRKDILDKLFLSNNQIFTSLNQLDLSKTPLEVLEFYKEIFTKEEVTEFINKDKNILYNNILVWYNLRLFSLKSKEFINYIIYWIGNTSYNLKICWLDNLLDHMGEQPPKELCDILKTEWNTLHRNELVQLIQTEQLHNLYFFYKKHYPTSIHVELLDNVYENTL